MRSECPTLGTSTSANQRLIGAVRKVFADQIAYYESIELTDLGRHGKLVTQNLQRDVEYAISVSIGGFE